MPFAADETSRPIERNVCRRSPGVCVEAVARSTSGQKDCSWARACSMVTPSLRRPDRMEPENRAALEIEFSGLKEGHGSEGNSNVRWLARRQPREPFAGHADN